MAKVSSNWKFTFDPAGVSPVVLLAYGDLTEGEVRFPYRRSLEVIDITEGAAPFLRLNGNAAVTIEFERYTIETDDKTARQAIMDSLLAIDALGKKPLRVEISGITDRYWQFANAVIHIHEPSRWLESARARVCKRYTITATGLAEVVI